MPIARSPHLAYEVSATARHLAPTFDFVLACCRSIEPVHQLALNWHSGGCQSVHKCHVDGSGRPVPSCTAKNRNQSEGLDVAHGPERTGRDSRHTSPWAITTRRVGDGEVGD